MKAFRSSSVLLLAVLMASFVAAQAKPGTSLQDVLALMDRTSREFKTVQADFVSDQYQRVVDEHDRQSGTTFFRRTNKGMEMYATFNQPNEKQVLFANGAVQVYLPHANQINKYIAGKNKDVFESFLVLGFGGSGQDLLKSFDVKLAGIENVNGASTYRLDLTPKSPRARGMFQTIILWIDPVRGVSVQQKFIEPSSGDYRIATYSNIKVNTPLGDSVFALKTKSNPKVVTASQ